MADNAYFTGNPVKLDISRSRMHVTPRWTGHWDLGRLVPIFATNVMPGSTYSMKVDSAVRMVQPVVPVMDDMDITIEAYFVSNRLTLSRKSMSPDVNDSNQSWEAFIGAQDSLLNMPTPGTVTLPQIQIHNDVNDYTVGGLADCLGWPKPTGTDAVYVVNPLKPLAYFSIWNEYFREPNTQTPCTYSISGGLLSFAPGDGTLMNPNGHSFSYLDLAGVSRYHGYFGSALPWPQRNSTQVTLPIQGLAPVGSTTNNIDGVFSQTLAPLKLGVYSNLSYAAQGNLSMNNNGTVHSSQSTPDGSVDSYTTRNLWADLSQATAASVNQFRLAVQTQRWYEALARSGNKYPDLINGLFDVRAQSIPTRPEYLGGFTAPIQMSQVASTADSTGTGVNSGLGKVGAFSLSNPGGFLFSKSFTEHGILMVVMCCRVKESFSQGVAREDTRFDRFDFYWPQFANLGEQPILKQELLVHGLDSSNSYGADKDVFGYQEAWAEERMIPDITTGQFRAGGNMEQWTYVNNFSTNAPSLKGYLDARYQATQIDKTLAVAHGTAGFQLFGQFQFDITMVKPMPLYSIPGLVDHH